MLRIRITLLLIFTIAASHVLIGQNSSIDYEFRLQEVTFIEGEGRAPLDIYKDKSGNSNRYFPPHYSTDNSSELRKPVAYVSGATPAVEIVIATDCPAFFVRGINDVMMFEMIGDDPSVTDEVTGLNTVILLGAESFEDGIIRYFEDFVIEYEVSTDGINWMSLDSSINTLYVPYRSTGHLTVLQHTVFDISCRAANGLRAVTETEIASVITTIFNSAYKKNEAGQFPEIFSAVSGEKLTYYGVHPLDVDPPYTCAPSALRLLDSKDGRCGAWGELFNFTIQVQGMDWDYTEALYAYFLQPTTDRTNTGEGIIPMSAASKDSLESDFNAVFSPESYHEDLNLHTPYYYFMVKNWNDAAEGQFIELYEGLGLDSIYEIEIAQSALGSPGVLGQGNVQDPRSIFRNHSITYYPGMILDPSYGVSYFNPEWQEDYQDVNLNQYENDNLATARGTLVKRQISEDVYKYYYWVEELIHPTDFQFILW